MVELKLTFHKPIDLLPLSLETNPFFSSDLIIINSKDEVMLGFYNLRKRHFENVSTSDVFRISEPIKGVKMWAYALELIK